MADWKDWLGRETRHEDDIVRGPAERLSATLGDLTTAWRPGAETLPPLWHWLYFLEATPRARTGPDGHAAKGGFLPPVPLPRRMYAGGRFTFPGALRFGATAGKRSTIASVAEKTGRTGPLAFVTVRHEIAQGGQIVATEEHDIVYREAARPGEARDARPRSDKEALSEESVTPDAVMLFRFSALTFNSHRIHYDHPYVTDTEGYPGLIVHGPLIAMLLFEAARRAAPERPVVGFTFRAMSPFFCGASLRLARTPGTPDRACYEARAEDDTLVMVSTVDFAA